MKKWFLAVFLVTLYVLGPQAQAQSHTVQGTINTYQSALILGVESGNASIILDADEGDDVPDTWTIQSQASTNLLRFLNHTSAVLTLDSSGITTWIIGGTSRILFSSTTIGMVNSIVIRWSSTGNNPGSSFDTFMERSKANVVRITNALNLVPMASQPATPASGDIYIDSTPTPDELCYYDGAAWQGISSGTDANCQ